MPVKQGLFQHYFEFEGKRYTIHLIRNSQSGAARIARSLQSRGISAKILQYSPGISKWAVYARKVE